MRRIIHILLLVCLAGIAHSSPAQAQSADRQSDSYISGYLGALLEHTLGWPRDSFRLEVRDGIARIRLVNEDAARRDQLATRLPIIEGLRGIQVVMDNAPAPSPVREKVYSFLGISPDTQPFPIGDLFVPMVADPKQPRFSVSYRRYRTPAETINGGDVGFGETFGFYRREGRRAGDGLQVSIAGAIFAQFNLDAPSHDLVNADYVIGLPVTYRHGVWSSQLRLYHQSSHLGDEFLLRTNPERINLSFEALELLVARDVERWRGYFGGEYMVHHEPTDLRPGGLHGGVEYHGRRPYSHGGRLVGGLDLKSWHDQNWSVNASLKLGLEYGSSLPGARRLRILAEAYDGYAPHGQFYDTKISSWGFGLYFGF